MIEQHYPTIIEERTSVQELPYTQFDVPEISVPEAHVEGTRELPEILRELGSVPLRRSSEFGLVVNKDDKSKDEPEKNEPYKGRSREGRTNGAADDKEIRRQPPPDE